MLTICEAIRLVLTALLIAAAAICYINVLSLEKCCNWFWRWGMKWEGKWFWEPIWGCHKCAAGQMALWGYLFYCFRISFKHANIVEVRPYSLTDHLLLILLSILFSACLNVYLQKKGWI